MVASTSLVKPNSLIVMYPDIPAPLPTKSSNVISGVLVSPVPASPLVWIPVNNASNAAVSTEAGKSNSIFIIFSVIEKFNSALSFNVFGCQND